MNARAGTAAPSLVRSIASLTGRRRRFVMSGIVLVGTTLLLFLSPVLFAASLVADLVTNPRRRRFSRLLGMGLEYLVLETMGIVTAIGLWIVTGFGAAMRTRWSQRLHHSVQRWWTARVQRAVERWFGAHLDITDLHLLDPTPLPDTPAPIAGPSGAAVGAATVAGHRHHASGLVIAARHASFFDAVIPAVLLGRAAPERGLRHVLTRGLAFDPCLDIYGHRLRNHFVDRLPRDRGAELDRLASLADDLGTDAAIIFPEGTFHTAARARREHDRIAKRDPERLTRVEGLRHVLPIRPGGLLALLDRAGAQGADLVVIGHTGFEPFGSFRAIMAEVPFRRPVRVKVWRVATDDLPHDPDQLLAAVDHLWQEMDDWIDLHRAPTPSNPRNPT